MKAIHYPSSLEFKFDNEVKNFSLSSDDFKNSSETYTPDDIIESLDDRLTAEEKQFIVTTLQEYEWI